MTYINIDQGTDAWLKVRLGKVTASRVADVIAKTKSGPSASRANYMAQLIAERLTGQVGELFTNASMQWGTEKEPEARIAYEAATGLYVEQVGFVDHPSIPMSGASPDGLVGFDGLVEIKCPNTSTHIDTIISGKVPTKYIPQMQWQMACTGTQWCDFVSYDPRMPLDLQLFAKRVDRDDSLIGEYEREIIEFLNEASAKVDALRELGGMK